MLLKRRDVQQHMECDALAADDLPDFRYCRKIQQSSEKME